MNITIIEVTILRRIVTGKEMIKLLYIIVLEPEQFFVYNIISIGADTSTYL